MIRMPRPALLRPAAMHAIVPPWLLHRVAEADPQFPTAAAAAGRSLRRDAPMRELRAATEPPPFIEREEEPPTPAIRASDAEPDRRISDAQCEETLPGRLVR